MIPRIFLLAVLVFLGSLMPGGLTVSAQETLKKPSEMPKPLLAPVVGHRGFSYDFPENTALSSAECAKVGAHGCECDLMVTKDGKVVLFHDGRTNRKVRTADGKPVPGRIADYDFETLRTFDVGVWKGEQFRGIKITTLDEYLDALKGTDCLPVFELKTCPPDPIVKAVEERGLEKACIFISASRFVRERHPEISTAVLLGKAENVKDEDLPDYLENLLTQNLTNVVDIHHSRITPEIAKELKARGIYIMVWTVNDPARMEALYRMGVDSITTDRPDVALEIYRKLQNEK